MNGLAMRKRLFESTRNKTRKGSRWTFRPAVEVLEARLLPSLTPTTLVPGGGGDGTNVMSWVPVTGAVKYNIYSGPSSGHETPDAGGTGLTNPSYIDTGNPNGVPIFYQFTAVDSAGQESARSNEIQMTPFNTMPLVAVDPTIGASTFFEDENAILGGFETTQIDGGMPYPRLQDVNAPNDPGIPATTAPPLSIWRTATRRRSPGTTCRSAKRAITRCPGAIARRRGFLTSRTGRRDSW